jgi:uncharacterized protein (DUF302 family)
VPAEGHLEDPLSMIEQTTRYGFSATVREPYASALARVKEALSREGFGILTEIDVAATFERKLGIEFRPYTILGACNPPLAHQALTLEREIGLLLPCNVVVYAGDEPGSSVVSAMDPVEALELTGREEIRPIAVEVRQRLMRALQSAATPD